MVAAPAPGSSAALGLPSTTGAAIPESLGRYRLLSKIAKGGMAEVFAARSYGVHGFEKTVALKRILPKFGQDPQFVRMMVDEAKISVLLNHPNIAQVLELGEQDGDYFIVMEFVPGQSLSSLIKRLKETHEKVPTLEACFIVVELLQGLHAAHTQSDMTGKPAHIIHRDVSPQNTLLSFDGHVKVIDFGIARARDRLEATEIGTIKGKLRYLAPEMIDPGRFAPKGDFDHRVDVFAAGIVLWELIAGRVLFVGEDEIKVYDEITDGSTPNLNSEGLCDDALMKIIDRALVRPLNKRYPDAEEFADALRAYVYRADPAFTHKRVAAILDRAFPDEKADLISLERGQTLEVPSARGRPQSAQPTVGAPLASSRTAGAPTNPLAERSDKHPPASARQSYERISDQATQLGDLSSVDPLGELRKDIPIVTLVSRQSVMATAGFKAPLDDSEVFADNLDHQSFSHADDATQTLSADSLRADKIKTAAARSAAASFRPALTPAVAENPVPPAPERSDKAVVAVALSSQQLAQGASKDETASTRRSQPGDDTPRMRNTLILVSATVGVLIALGIVGVLELFETRHNEAVVVLTAAPSSSGAAPVVAPAVGEALTLTLRTALEGAVVVVGDERGPSPLRLKVHPGAVLSVRVDAAGGSSETENIVVAADQSEDFIIDMAPRFQPVPVVVVVEPAAAQILIDGELWQKDTTVVPHTAIVVDVSAQGFVAVRREMKALPATALAINVTLVPDAKASASPGPGSGVLVKKPVSGRSSGTLKLRTTPWWGQVSIDGNAYEDQTPLSVQLSAGSHDVVVSHPPRGLVQRFKVIVKSNETVTRTITFD